MSTKYKSYIYSFKFCHPRDGTIKWYYGVRYSKILDERTPEEDFFYHYRGSSKELDHYFDEYTCYARLRKKFKTIKEGLNYEQKFLTRVNAAYNKKFINKHNGGSNFHNIYHIPSEKEIQLKREKMLGKNNHQYGRKGKLSPNWGRKNTQETIEKMRKSGSGVNNGFFGKKHSKETKDYISKINKGNSYNLGKKRSIEAIEKFKKSMSLIPNAMENPETRAKVSAKRKNGIWITNGKQNKFWQKDKCFPEGFFKGMIYKGELKLPADHSPISL